MSSEQNEVRSDGLKNREASNKAPDGIVGINDSTRGSSTNDDALANTSQKGNAEHASSGSGKWDERNLIEIAEDDYPQIRNEPKHLGGSDLESPEKGHSIEDEGVAKVPNNVFQRQNTKKENCPMTSLK